MPAEGESAVHVENVHVEPKEAFRRKFTKVESVRGAAAAARLMFERVNE